METAASLWRAGADPRSAHRLAESLLGEAAYAHTRGVAQQAARLVAEVAFDPVIRRRVLAGAWTHDLGLAVGGGALGAARALRRSGNEELARLVAHQLAGGPGRWREGASELDAEFPGPGGAGRVALDALDAAIITTAQDGARVTPRESLAAIVEARGVDDPWVQALVARVAELADDARAAAWIQALSPAAA